MRMHALYSAESLYGSLLVQDAVSQSIQVTFSKEIRVPCRHTFQGRPTIRPSWPTAYRYGQRFDGHSCLLKVAQRHLSQVSSFASVPALGSICGVRPAGRSAIRPSGLQLPRAGQRVDRGAPWRSALASLRGDPAFRRS